MVRNIKPSPEIVCSGHRVPVVVSAVVNQNPFRWDCCRELEKIFHPAFGHHGSASLNALLVLQAEVLGSDVILHGVASEAQGLDLHHGLGD
jgi:hypothetical protein